MTSCPYQQTCGGCPYRDLSLEDYRNLKTAHFARTIAQIRQENIKTGEPVFIADGTRRRAELTFLWQHGHLQFGFNKAKSHEIINIEKCPLLTANINMIILKISHFLNEFCNIKSTEKLKNKKFRTYNISKGDIHLTETANGLDVLFEITEPLSLEHRMSLSDFASNESMIIRLSVQIGKNNAETISEKNRPILNIGGYQVFVPTGTFLQASHEGEQALIKLVKRYIGDTTGKIADLFCGVGTFSYPLAENRNNKILAVDSSSELLAGFQKSVNANMIQNIQIWQRNLFKYPLDNHELKNFAAVVFDPPRAGAAAQAAQIAAMSQVDKPKKIVAVSCNPYTFVNDANTLLKGGYHLTEITLIDQFVYSKHSELVALFEKL